MLIIIIYMAFVALGLPDSLMGAAWPVMGVSLGATVEMAGYVSIITCFGTIISSLISGTVLRRFRTGLVVASSVLLTALGLLGTSLSHSILSVMLFALPLGIGAGCIDVALNNFVATHFKAKHMSWLHSCWGVGATLGPVMLSVSLAGGNWRGGYFTVTAILFAMSVLLFFSLSLWKTTEARTEETKKAVTLRQAIKKKGVKPVMVAFFACCAYESAAGLWAASYLLRERGFDASTAALGASFFYAAITVGRFVTGFLSSKISAMKLIFSGVVIAIVGTVLLPTNLALLGFVFIGIGTAPFYPMTIHETPKRFGENYSAAVIALQMAVSYVAFLAVPPLIGNVAGKIGFFVLPIILLLFEAITLIFSIITLKTAKTSDIM
ncbi:MFS transporter [Clostridia bacterium]|nr:MFS transporter [Clostridia bacterium]